MSEQLSTREVSLRTEPLLDVSLNPEIERLMEESLSAAACIMALNRARVESNPEEVENYLPINVLGSTQNKFDCKEVDPFSMESLFAINSQRADVEKLIEEVVTAKGFRITEPIFQVFDYETRDYSTLGTSHSAMVRNGLSPLSNPEERIIRQIEFMEEILLAELQEQLEGEELSIVNIKECPEWAKRAYENNESNTGGYVPSENKFVIQQFKFVQGGRYYSQASLSGKNISHEDILEALSILSGNRIDGDSMHVRSKYFITELNIENLIESLDDIASSRLGKEISLGEENKSEEKNYQDLSSINKLEKNLFDSLVNSTVDFLDRLHLEKINPIVAGDRLDTFLSKLIYQELKENDEIMKNAFGAEYKESISPSGLIMNLPRVEYCGAGSCGIEFANAIDSAKAKGMGLKGEIGVFPEGKCIKCYANGFIVGDNGKYCDKCGALDLIS